MQRLGRFISRYAIWVIVLFVLVGGAVAFVGVDPGSESDVLKFLPKSNPDVGRFYHVNEKFGALNIAIVGIQEDDIFNPDFMNRLAKTTRVLQNEVKGIHRVLGLTTLSDFVVIKGKEGGIQPKVLVDVEHLPKSKKEWEKLKESILAKRHVKGHFVNREGNATVLLCYLAPKGQVVPITKEIKKEVRKRFPKAKLYWGGNPFISAHIFRVTEDDMRSLTPWAVGLILLVTLLSFRDPVGVLLALIATVFGGAITFAAMKLMGVKVNIVLSSMPVLLFAVGSAYSIHFLVRYYTLRREQDTDEAIQNTHSSVGPGILAAGLTTVSGFFSFLAMDMQPMREFGLYTGLGILSCLLGALLLIPAVLSLSKRKRKKKEKESQGLLTQTMGHVAAFAARHRVYISAGLLALGVFGLYYSTQVKLAMETSSFFNEGSEPDVANKFLSREFGGSQYVQIHVKADFDDPVVLKSLRRLADKIETVEHISAVQHVAQPFAMVSEAWVDLRRIPDTRPRVQTLANYVLTDPASLQLMTRNHDEALIHAKVRTNDANELVKVVDEIRKIVDREWGEPFVAVNLGPKTPVKVQEEVRKARAGLVADHLVALMRRAGHPEVLKKSDALAKQLAKVQKDWKFVPNKKDTQEVSKKLHKHLRSAECVIPLPPAGEGGDAAEKLADAIAALGPKAGAKAKDEAGWRALEGSLDKESALSLVATMEPYLIDAWKMQKSRAIIRKVGQTMGVQASSLDAKSQKALQVALLDLHAKRVAVRKKAIPADALKAMTAAGAAREKEAVGDGDGASGAGTKGGKTARKGTGVVAIKAFLTGAPVLNQGLSRSVEMNQIRSLVVSGILVILVMGVIFRSLLAAVVALLPAGMTILMIFGYMGFRELYLDVGTSMIASIALGVGIDYAIHFMVWWRRAAKELATKKGRDDLVHLSQEAARIASEKCGVAILTNAVMVAGAFIVLAMGDAAPLKTFGTMTAGAMFVAAAMAFMAVPALSGSLLMRRWALAGGEGGEGAEATDETRDKASVEEGGRLPERELAEESKRD